MAEIQSQRCAWCEGKFTPKTRKAAKFCSLDCGRLAFNQQRRERVRERRREAGIKCAWCGDPLDVERRTSSRFCGQTCSDAFHNHARSTANARAVKAQRQPCAFCGGKIPPERRAGAIYCSYQCKNDAGNVPSARRREQNRRYMLKYTRGITVEQFDAMLAAQGGRCAICGTTEAGGRRGTFHVDHCHASGLNRGLLCNECNVGLGKFKDDPAALRAAADYLERHAP